MTGSIAAFQRRDAGQSLVEYISDLSIFPKISPVSVYTLAWRKTSQPKIVLSQFTYLPFAILPLKTVIIHRVVAHEDPPFRPDVPSMEMKPEYIELMVDCWNDEPEERPHFYRIVERLKKESGRYISVKYIIFF